MGGGATKGHGSFLKETFRKDPLPFFVFPPPPLNLEFDK